MYGQTEDDCNTIVKEERAYQTWEKEQRNRILNMTNPVRKQEEWHKLYPKLALSDELQQVW